LEDHRRWNETKQLGTVADLAIRVEAPTQDRAAIHACARVRETRRDLDDFGGRYQDIARSGRDVTCAVADLAVLIATAAAYEGRTPQMTRESRKRAGRAAIRPVGGENLYRPMTITGA